MSSTGTRLTEAQSTDQAEPPSRALKEARRTKRREWS